MKTVKILMLLLAVTVLGSRADDSIPTLRPVTSSYMIEVGKAHIADTYLTPLHYRGTHWSLQYERDQAMRFNPVNWTMQLKFGGVLDHTRNPAKNATMLNASLQGAWAMMRRWRLPKGFSIGVGPSTSFDAGVLYLSRNSNNPASAKVGWTVDVTGYLSWRGTFLHIPMTLRYQPTLPLTGVFFSPDYGELYYQIYLGDDDGLVHGAWPCNYFNMDNLLTADLHFGCTSLRIGYHNRIFSSKVNNITSQDITHALVLGVTTEWITLRPDRKTIEAKIISAY